MKFRLFVNILIFYAMGFLHAQEIFQERILVALHPQTPALPVGKVTDASTIKSSELWRLMQKYHVVRIEKWLKSADDQDVFEGIAFNKIYRFYLEKSSLRERASRAFKASSEVLEVNFEPKVKIAVPIPPYVTNDPFIERQYYLDKILAKYVWTLAEQISPPDRPILIGIVDTGIDYLHPEMEPALYINPGEDVDGDGQFTSADLNGLDDDGNGFVDDVRGWDFSYASDSVAGDNDIRPPNAGGYEILSHGTHVAGIAGAMANNELGISGIARGYKIIGTKHSLDDDLSHGYLYNAYDGILYCAKLGADVVNCSWGGPGYYDLAQKLIDMVREDYGTIVVAAAGNDNNNNDNHHFYPGDLNGVVTVAALGPDDRKASFSNYGNVIDISAPGVGILSTIHYYKGGYATWQGTSMASPVVAGSIALLKYFFPDLSPDELAQKVLDAADPLDDLNPSYQGLLGAGRVNIYNAIGPSFLPALKIVQDSLQFEDLNQSGQIDPGERIQIGLQVRNKPNWQIATDVQVVLSTGDSLLHLLDSVAYIGDLEPGEEIWTALNDFQILPDQKHTYGQTQILFTIRGKTANGQLIEEHFPKEISLSLFQNHFPKRLNPGSIPVSVLKDSLTDETRLCLITMDNHLLLLNAKGEIIPPFPIDLLEFHRVPQVVVDVDNDGQQEIATLSNYGKLKVFKQNGSLLLDVDLNEVVYGNFAVDDLDGDGQFEFVIATMRKKLHVIALDGSELEGFPVQLNGFVPQGVAIGDVDASGTKEIAIGTFDKKLHLFDYQGKERPGWPVELPVALRFTPVISKDKNGTFIWVITKSNQLIKFNPQGSEELSVNLRSDVNFDPFLMDSNQDGLLEYCFIDEKNQFIGYSSDNHRFLFDLDMELDGIPLVFWSNSQLHLIDLNSKGQVALFDEHFSLKAYSPIYLPWAINRSISLTDLDGDGDVEAIVTGNEQLVVLDLPDSIDGQQAWSTYLANERRTSYFEIDSTQTTGLDDNQTMPLNFVVKAFPNPFNSTVKIRISGERLLKGEKVSVKIYDIRGRLITTLKEGIIKSNSLHLTWHGQNRNGLPVSSGLYFIKVQVSDAFQMIKKIGYIK
ncbi:MAG: S8 family peptidase [Caldisericaceae bacterium]|nr:S8 family peptidase [Caldisericaceae bacterium]